MSKKRLLQLPQLAPVGYYVTAYIKVDNNNENLIYIEKNASKTNEIIIDAKDFIKYSDKRIKYENSENGKTYTAQIESDVDVVFEGGPLSIYNEDTFKISDGNIRLIDNDNNGTYDVIFINPVQTMAVNSINYEKKFITDYFNNSRTLDLNDIEDKNITVVNQDGKDIKFTNIVQGNVITWSKDSKGKYYKIIVMQDAMIEGSITGVSGDDSYISVNDDIYTMEPYFKSIYDSTVKIGDSGILYVDYQGRAVGFRTGKGSAKVWNYGYLIGTYCDEPGENYFLKVLTENGTLEDMPVANKLTVDLVSTKGEERVSKLQNLSQQVIRYKLNANDEIAEIDTAEDDASESSLVKKYESESIGFKGLGVDSFTNMAAVNASTVVFVIPVGGNVSVNDYTKTDVSYLQSDASYNMIAYGRKDAIVSDVIVVRKANTADSGSAEFGIIEGYSYEVNNDEEAVVALNMYVVTGSGMSNEKVFVSPDLDIPDIAAGQMIEFKRNFSNEIISIKTLYDHRTNLKTGFSEIGVNMVASPRAVFGKVAQFEDGLILISDDDGEINMNELKGEIFSYKTFKSQGRVFVCDTTKKSDNVSKAEDSDIYDYVSVGENCSRAVVITNMCWPQAMIIYN